MVTTRIDQLTIGTLLSTDWFPNTPLGGPTTRINAVSLFGAGTSGNLVQYNASGLLADSGKAVSALAATNSPTFTGVPTAPTALNGTNTAQIATTAFVLTAIAGASYVLPVATQSILGGVMPDGTSISNSGGVISVAYGNTANTAVQGNDTRVTGALSVSTAASTYAPLVSPTLSGTPTCPTAIGGTSSTQIASTAFVTSAISAATYTLPIATSSVLGGVKPDGTTLTNSAGAISVTYGSIANTAVQGNDSRVTNALSTATAASTYAPLISPVFTGTPTGPTAVAGTSTTQLATTAFVAGIASIVRRLTADFTNATASLTNLSDLTVTLPSSGLYVGQLVLKCANSSALDGLQFDFNGGTATMTAFWATSGVLASSGTITIGTNIVTAISSLLNFSLLTGETTVVTQLYIQVNAGGTLIPRAAENAHTTGTLTVRKGSYITLTPCGN